MLRVLLLVVVACWCAESFFISSNKASSSMILFNAKTPLVANGKRIEADPGSSLIAACTKLGLKVPTKCKKGECGTCTVTVAGSKYRSCIAKVPPGTYLCSIHLSLTNILPSSKVKIVNRKGVSCFC